MYYLLSTYMFVQKKITYVTNLTTYFLLSFLNFYFYLLFVNAKT